LDKRLKDLSFVRGSKATEDLVFVALGLVFVASSFDFVASALCFCCGWLGFWVRCQQVGLSP
jgi:hypothetical protein